MLQHRKSIGYEHARMGVMNKTLAEIIKERREALGIKSYELADKIGRRPSLISRIENSDYKETPPPDIIAGLAEALDIPQYQMLAAMGYRVGDVQDSEEEIDPEIEELVALLRRAQPNFKDRFLLRSLLTDIGKINRGEVPG